MTRVVPLFLCPRCFISLSMSIQSVYRRMPTYLAAPLALVASAVAALTLAVLGEVTLVFLLGKIHGPGDLGDAMLAFFCAAPSIAVLAFVSWPLHFGGIGFAWYVPGTFAWLVSCWFLHRKSISHYEHVFQA